MPAPPPPTTTTTTAHPSTSPPPTGAPGMPGMPPAPSTPPGLQPGLLSGPDGAQAVIVSEEAYAAELEKESHGLHLGVLGIGVVLASIFSAAGAGEMGAAGAVVACFGVILTLLVTTPVNTVAAWLVGKMFGQDFGVFPVLLLRVGAVTAAYTAVMSLASLVLGPWISMLLGLPVMVLLAVWLIGMDLFQSLVLSVVITMIKWFLAGLIMMTLASALAVGGPTMDEGAWDEYGAYEEHGYEGDGYYDDW